MNIIQKAKEYAIIKHGEQKYGSYPYLHHLEQVYELLYFIFPNNTNLLASAYLHDIIEDTNTTKKNLQVFFNDEIADLVYSVSGFGNSRKEKQESIIEKININKDYINLKLADRIANMTFSLENDSKFLKQYIKEMEIYDKSFSKGHFALYNKFLSFKQERYEPIKNISSLKP